MQEFSFFEYVPVISPVYTWSSNQFQSTSGHEASSMDINPWNWPHDQKWIETD